jgi:oxygen-independent coproporphyrinogen-3 oxidase
VSTTVASVYVHAPFCARRCVYCDFAVSVRRVADVGGWLSALGAELEWLREEGLFRLAEPIETLYVGGGTPSLMGAEAMGRLAALFGSRVDPERIEWTVEANPESFTPAVAGGWAAAGVNRISLGVQTFHEPALRWMGRLHGAEGARRALQAARDASIENVSVDLIFALPASTGRSWRDDLDGVLSLGVPHVSLYGLSVEPGTPLGRDVSEGRVSPVDEERYRDEFLAAAEVLTGAGYEHYEVSNFARPGFRSRHNAAYWDGSPYLGLGNGAHGFAPPIRRWNVRSWEDYSDRMARGASPVSDEETLDAEAQSLERVWLGLRTRAGVPHPRAGSPAHALVSKWLEAGWAERSAERVRLTAQGWLLLDRLAVELDRSEGVVVEPPLRDRWPRGRLRPG